MSKALREETAVDKHGRTYRVNHSARINKDGTQMTFWAMMGFAREIILADPLLNAVNRL